jgi:hypothetical protein
VIPPAGPSLPLVAWSTIGAGPTLARIHLDRHDDFTAANLGKTLAGFFDSRYCTPERQKHCPPINQRKPR